MRYLHHILAYALSFDYDDTSHCILDALEEIRASVDAQGYRVIFNGVTLDIIPKDPSPKYINIPSRDALLFEWACKITAMV